MTMKKKVLLLSTAGIAAGLTYALKSNRRKQAACRESLNDSESSTNGKASEILGANPIDSAERGSSMSASGKSNVNEIEAHPLDDHGTNQMEASRILRDIRDNAFDASDEKVALALGRTTEEIEEWISGSGLIDGDALMKARALAIQRGLEVE
jgi:hypothetical protein